jgi:hypothetical protein
MTSKQIPADAREKKKLTDPLRYCFLEEHVSVDFYDTWANVSGHLEEKISGIDNSRRGPASKSPSAASSPTKRRFFGHSSPRFLRRASYRKSASQSPREDAFRATQDSALRQVSKSVQHRPLQLKSTYLAQAIPRAYTERLQRG